MSLTWEQQLQAIEEAIDRFPDEFGLRNFPGRKFCISRGSSYFGEEPMLYTYIWDTVENQWLAFSKGTESELRREVVAL